MQNKSVIFKRAWAIAQDASKRFGGKSIDFFNEALRIAWRERKMNAIDLTKVYYAGKSEELARNYDEKDIVLRAANAIFSSKSETFDPSIAPKKGTLHTNKEGLNPKHCFDLKNGLFFYCEEMTRIVSDQELETWEKVGKIQEEKLKVEKEKKNAEFGLTLKTKAIEKGLKITEYKIQLGALTEIPVEYCPDKNWAATVKIDPKAPGGLDRNFWRKANGDNFYYLLPGHPICGKVIEFGMRWGKKKNQRAYVIVLCKTEHVLETLMFQDYNEAFNFLA